MGGSSSKSKPKLPKGPLPVIPDSPATGPIPGTHPAPNPLASGLGTTDPLTGNGTYSTSPKQGKSGKKKSLVSTLFRSKSTSLSGSGSSEVTGGRHQSIASNGSMYNSSSQQNGERKNSGGNSVGNGVLPIPGGSAAPGSNVMNPNKIYIALFSYAGRDDGELSFEKGDKLVVLDDSEPDWWLAHHINTPERKAYIPMNFVVSSVIETEEWFFSKISRREGERLLLFGADYPRGTFLVRNSEQGIGSYSLSIRDFDAIKMDHVKHYKIQTRPNGDFFITSKRSFMKLQDLIDHYSIAANGLCHRLTKPCPRVARAVVGPAVRSDEIDRRDLKLIRELGSGNFGKVYYGVYKGQTPVAIKTLKPGSMTVSAFLQEAAIMRRYRHEKLVPLYGVCSVGQPLLIVTEFMSRGALLNYLRDNPESSSLTMTDLIDMASQIAAGMAYLERVKLVHRDLAARNCLVGDNKVVKVADFGLARIIEDEYYVAQVNAKFPIKWTAPEAAAKGKFTSKSDVWSFGVLLYELVTKGKTPYLGMSNLDVLEQVARGYRMPKPKDVECPNALYSVMLQCWDRDPDKRPTFEYLHSYFDDFFIATEPRYRDAEDFASQNIPKLPEPEMDSHYDMMVK